MVFSNRIILIEPDLERCMFLKRNISRHLKAEVVELKNVQDVIKFLISDSKIDLIYAQNKFSGVNHLGVLASFLKKSKLEIPLLYQGEPILLYDNECELDSDLSLKKIIRNISTTLNIILDEESELSLTDFKSIPIEFFFQVDQTFRGCALYRGNNNTSPDLDYEILYESQEKISRDEIIPFYELGIKELFVLEEFEFDVYFYSTKKLIKKLNDLKFQGRCLELELLNDAYLVSRKMIEKGKLDTELKLILQSIALKLSELSNQNIKVLIANLNNARLDYSFKRLFLIHVLGEKVLEMMSLKSESSLLKYIHINLFHDITIFSEILLLIHSEAELETSNLTKNEITQVNEHAQKAAELVNTLSISPQGTAEMLIEHHGSKSGLGLKNKLSINLSPMMMIFIVVEEFSIELLKNEGEIKFEYMAQTCNKLGSIYNKITFKAALNSLIEITQNYEK